MVSKVTTKRLGSGITAHTQRRTTYDMTQPLTKDELAEIRGWFANIKRRDGIGDARGLAERTIADIEAGDADPDDFEPYEGMGWYSREIIERCDRLDRAKERDEDSDRVAQLGYEIGALITEARIVWAWNDAARTGAKSLDGAAEGGRVRAAEKASKHAAILEDYTERLSRTREKSAAKRETARQFGITSRHLNRILAKYPDPSGQRS